MEALLQLRLLADARHQRVRRRRPPAAHRAAHQRDLRARTRPSRPRSRARSAARGSARTSPASRRPTRPTRPGGAARKQRRGTRERRAPRRAAPRPGDPEAPPKPGQRDLSQPQITLPPRRRRSCSTSCRGVRGRAPDPLADERRRRPPNSSSTSCSRHETRREQTSIVAEPGAGRRGHGAHRRASRCCSPCKANHGPAVRADLQRQGRAARRPRTSSPGNEVRVGGFQVGIVEEIRRRSTEHQPAGDRGRAR